ncbi:MAG: ribonuclease III [Candidatus Woykebacteria bacterium]
MDFSELENKIGLTFKDQNLLKTAFIHRSYLNEHPEEKLPNNERLEFLGDSVLGFIISNYLYEKYPRNPEGDLTNFRSSIVNAKTLAEASGNLGLGEFLFLSKGEEATGGKERQYILANTYESLLGAIYLDQGIDAASKFVDKTLIPKLSVIIEKKLYKDFKSKLQEASQANHNVTPSYKLVSETGPDHSKVFETGAYLGQKLLAKGKGASKQAAEQEAAKSALEKLDKLS